MYINKQSKTKEYKASKYEMNRRKRAFITLSISLFLTICIFSLDVIISMPKILVPSLIIFAMILILLIVRLNKTHDKQSYMQIQLTDSELKWIFKDSCDICLLSDIKSIRIKRTTKGLIREIRIITHGMKFLYINGLEEFEEFISYLISKTENVNIINYREPVDFDHPLYYVFFGIVFGIITTLTFRVIPLIGLSNIKYVQLIISCFIIFVGIFFVLNKPVRGRYGSKNKNADYVCGLFFLAIGVFIIIYSKNF